MLIDDHTIGFIKASGYRLKILNILHEDERVTPTEIASKLEANLPQVSRTLSELEREALITCSTPNRRKGKIYRITSRGINAIIEMRGY